jgi:hypothetical protein
MPRHPARLLQRTPQRVNASMWFFPSTDGHKITQIFLEVECPHEPPSAIRKGWFQVSCKDEQTLVPPAPDLAKRREGQASACPAAATPLTGNAENQCGDKSRAVRGSRHRFCAPHCHHRAFAQKAASRGNPLAAARQIFSRTCGASGSLSGSASHSCFVTCTCT